jgi:hypothetical protein
MRGNVLQQNQRVLPVHGSRHITLHLYTGGIAGDLLQQQEAVLFKKSCRKNGHGRSSLA